MCTLTGSTFLGTVEEVERETEYTYERTISIYGHPGLLVYPKGVWQKTSTIPVIEIAALEHYPSDGTN